MEHYIHKSLKTELKELKALLESRKETYRHMTEEHERYFAELRANSSPYADKEAEAEMEWEESLNLHDYYSTYVAPLAAEIKEKEQTLKMFS